MILQTLKILSNELENFLGSFIENGVDSKRVIIGNIAFYESEKYRPNTVEKREVSLSLLKETLESVVWKIKNAFTIKVQSVDLKSNGNEVAIETLEIAQEGLSVQNE